MFLEFLRWFRFEKVIEALVAKDIYHMELNQLQTITKRFCRIDDEVELKTMFKFYHDLGVIVKHGRTVVLQAQWLIDLFKQLITVRPFDEMVNNDTPHNFTKICFWFKNFDSLTLFIAKYILAIIKPEQFLIDCQKTMRCNFCVCYIRSIILAVQQN